MQKTSFLLMTFAALLSAGLVSCGKDDNDPSNTTVDWVDLGLPSGLLWNSCNLGASSPEKYGGYYAWGETTTKKDYSWKTYRYCTADGDLTKYNYNSICGIVDNLTTLEAMDDAATAALGSDVHTPTKAEWEELINNTTSEWTTVKGVKGCKFTAANGNSIFLPAAGYRVDTDLEFDGSRGSNGYYWSSTLVTDDLTSLDPLFAKQCSIHSFEPYAGVYSSGHYRSCGHSVRPVSATR